MMSLPRVLSPREVLIAFAFLGKAFSQVFGDASNGVPPLVYAPPVGLSTACNATFSTPIHCSPLLPTIAWEGYFPSVNDLRGLCNTSCLQSLGNLRNNQLSSCGADVATVAGLSYPATYNVDYFIFTYNYTCRTDRTTGAWCAPQVDLWGNEASPPANQTCSDCVLGTLQTELNSPFGYDANLATNFTSMTSLCRASGYPITSPAPYTASRSATTTSTIAAVTPSCSTSYTVQAGDSCTTISIAQNVSTFDLLYENGLEGYCSNFPTAGRKLCLPHQCDIYTVRANDTCYGITQANKDAFSISQLVSWNPNLNRDCSNIAQLVNMQICISFPGESGSAPVSTPSTMIAPQPLNMAVGTNTNCSRYYNISAGDYCSYITVQEGISLPDFYFLNPEINSTDCSNLLLGESYCVAPVGYISTYPGYGGTSATGAPNPCKGISAASSCFATTYSTGPDWSWPTQAATPTPTARVGPLPLASGTLSNCTTYDQHYASASGNSTTYNINSCYAVARFRGTTIDQLVTWNPSLTFDSKSPDSCVLVPGFRYCVSMTGVRAKTTVVPTTTAAISTTVVPPTTTTAPALTGTCSGGVSPPEQTQSGEPCWCQKWVRQVDGQYCAEMATAAGITLAQLYTLNPPLNKDCSGLYKGFAYCVAPVPTDSACAGGTLPPEQVQPGISCKCNSWIMQQSGKYCADMAAAAAISLQQLYNLNPALGGDCAGLFVGYAYCVGLAP